MNNHQLYVPEKFVASAEHIALHLAGGCTSFPGARGLWKDPSGTVHEDRITLVQVFETGTEARDAIVELLLQGGEMSVAYVTNDIPSLVESVEELEPAW